MTGTITRRGKQSWRIKFEAGERDSATGKRKRLAAVESVFAKAAERRADDA
jgi:hypothetical protein